ncbi:MAG TPA: CHAD domain-containing protein [Candidatus Binatia bacterium]|nr:CHAD domain-containing protein [Candidatus Binatia bacterium]
MPLDASELDRRVQQLRKRLKKFPKDPAPDDVHDLRTSARRVESILQSLGMDSSTNEKKLLAGLASVRKRAGKVRDMDVLTSDVVGLGLQNDPGCMLRLTKHLGTRRQRHARKLCAEVRRRAPTLRRRLKKSRRRLDSSVEHLLDIRLDVDLDVSGAEQAPLHATSEALRLSTELASVPRLGKDNLHPYRLEVKRLRYILEMAGEDGPQQAFIGALKQVQDFIGDWHDWVELAGIARDVLQDHSGCGLVSKIEAATRRKFQEALRVTGRMRRQYLHVVAAPAGSSRRRHKPVPLPGPVLLAASGIAA